MPLQSLRQLKVLARGLGLCACGAVLMSIGSLRISAAEPTACAPPKTGEPMFVTAGCRDPLLREAVIDIDEWRDTPARHRYVNGHFADTGVRFSFYFPPPERFQGRFFQLTHQLLTSENAPPESIAFAFASGGYFVQSIPGPREAIRSVADALSGRDSSLGGYRVNAVAAKYSRTVATRMYGNKRIYGYLYGGSGGAYQVISALQNSRGVWDGGLPFVMGSPHAIPNDFTVRIHALRVLKGKFPQIMDAIEPGGSGDMYAGLNAEERGALKEATSMGVPPRGWFDYPTLNGGPLALVAGYVPALDPTYVDDFWSKAGYLGADPSSSVAAARIQYDATIVSATPGMLMRVKLSSVPKADLTGADLVITSGAAAGKRVSMVDLVSGLAGLGGRPVQAVPLADEDAGSTVGVLGFGADPAAVAALVPGVKVRIDNSLYLALQTYHRHQVPPPEFHAWDQFRGPDGKPIYPQRKVLVGPIGNFNGAGSLPNGRFNGKMIVIENLMDIDALPWQADWYRRKVQQAGYGRSFRLYFIDHADHVGNPRGARATHLVDYNGALQQLLRDLTSWVERGTQPPAETRYQVEDNQIVVPASAAERRGIQPVIDLEINGGKRIEVKAGESVKFTAYVEVPPGLGSIVSGEWDFDGTGAYPFSVDAKELGRGAVKLTMSHSFDRTGTYFPALRVASQRDGDRSTPFARVQNLDRVRVVVN
jgi:hypothetical protein